MSQPAQHDAIVFPCVPMKRKPLESQDQAFNKKKILNTGIILHLSTPSTCSSPPSQIMSKDSSTLSLFPSLPASRGHIRLRSISTGNVEPPSTFFAGPKSSLNAAAQNGRPKRTIKLPVHFQD